MLRAVVLHDFQAVELDEINLLKGEIITDLETIDTGWWRGVGPSGQRGLFPVNFVELIHVQPRPDLAPLRQQQSIAEQVDRPRLRAVVLYDFKAEESDEMNLLKGDIITDLETIDTAWWRGVGPSGQRGLFPTNVVELIHVQPRPDLAPLRQRQSIAEQVDRPRLRAVVLYDFKAEESDEMNLKRGELITDLETIDARWWRGAGPSGQRGLFPAKFVELLQRPDIAPPCYQQSVAEQTGGSSQFSGYTNDQPRASTIVESSPVMRQAVRTSLSPSSHSQTSTISDFSSTSPSTNSLYRTSTTLEFSSVTGQVDCTSQSSSSHSRTSTISEFSPVAGHAGLVSPSPNPSQTSTILEFSSGDILKSDRLSLHGKPLYLFTRAKGLIVKRAEDSTLNTPVATLVRGDMTQPAKITLRGRETVRVDRWLCSAGKFSVLPVTFLENGEVWTWKMNNSGQLSLWLGGQQMAWWQRPVLQEQILTLPYLGLEDVAVRIQDVVVVSFMVLMQRLRSSAKTKDQVVLGAQLLGASLQIVNSVLGVVL